MKLSISRAWNEASDFVKRDFGTLFILAFALVALPGVFVQAMMPTPAEGEAPAMSVLLVLLILASAALSIIGSLAIAILALRRERVVGSALSLALRRFLPLLGASLLLGLAVALVAVPLLVLLGVGVSAGEEGGAALGAAALGFLIVGIVALLLWVRLVLMTPVAAAEEGGPIHIIRRSWDLTRGHFGKLLGFVLLMLIVLLVLSMAIGAVAGIVIALIFGTPEPGSIASFLVLLLSGIVNALFVLYFTATTAHIYEQLAPRTAEVFE